MAPFDGLTTLVDATSLKWVGVGVALKSACPSTFCRYAAYAAVTWNRSRYTSYGPTMAVHTSEQNQGVGSIYLTSSDSVTAYSVSSRYRYARATGVEQDCASFRWTDKHVGGDWAGNGILPRKTFSVRELGISLKSAASPLLHCLEVKDTGPGAEYVLS